MDAEALENLLVTLGLHRVTRRNQNLMACCPYHSENRPSWGISVLEPHLWGCFGCGERGTLFRLLIDRGYTTQKARSIANLRSEGYTLPNFAPLKKEHPVLDYQLLFPFTLRPEAQLYLESRRIWPSTAAISELTYDHTLQRLLFPWYLGSSLVGVTGRTIVDNEVKTLPYWGSKKGSCLYLPQRGIVATDPLILVEGETDALRVMQAGYLNVGAVAFGNFTKLQKNLVLNSGVTEVVLAFDPDVRGEKLRAQTEGELSGKVVVSKFDWAMFRKRYGEELDPAELLERDVRLAMKTRIKNCNFPMF